MSMRPDGPGQANQELANRGATSVALNAVMIRVSPHGPSLPWPSDSIGTEIALPSGQTLAPGQLLQVPVASSALAVLASDPAFEGVVTVFERGTGDVLDRVDFMRCCAFAPTRPPARRTLATYCPRAMWAIECGT
jgi:hypothetical protein